MLSKLTTLLNPRTDLSRLPSLVQPQEQGEMPAGYRRRFLFKEALLNVPLMLGSFIVLGLFLLVLFGPVWAPRNPYIAGQRILPHFDSVQEVWVTPPLSPSPDYPLGTDEWGNDILSMLMYGARNTLIMAAVIALARVLLGLILGASAGWHEGSWIDKGVMGVVGMLAAVPMLISSIILVYALDIRQGIPVFIAALVIVGWGEMAQYIRSEFLILRQMSYIEGAQAVGATPLAIAVRHILPNLLPQLLVITFLEIGAVLLLLGELSFVGVFIGGGSQIALGDELIGLQVTTLAEVPEWGAMLAEGYRWLRAKPFIVYPPALAFFIAVIGFNALGEGLRRFIEQYHVSTNFLLRKRMILVIAVMVYATVFIINNTGPAPWFAKVARAFSGDLAYEHVTTLTQMAGRGSGQAGGLAAADYIAAEFEAIGLQPGWRQSQYLHENLTQLVRPLSQPYLRISGNDVHLRHQIDFGYMIEGHGGSGEVALPVTFVGFTETEPTWEAFRGLDLQDQIVLLLADNAPTDFANEALIRGAKGVLWVVNDQPEAVHSQIQLANPEAAYLSLPQIPILRIRPYVAQAILDQTGLNLADLLELDSQTQAGRGWFTYELGVVVEIGVNLGQVEETPVPAVLGLMPGSDFEIANELVIVVATYDGLGQEPNGTVFPAANHNASGVAVMLELARLWQEQELNPRRSVWFVVWGGSQLDEPGLTEFLQNPRSIRHLPAQASTNQLRPRVIIQVDYTGAGADALYIHPESAASLNTLVLESAHEIELPVTRTTARPADIYRHPQANWLYFAWSGSRVQPHQDEPVLIDPQKLQQYGEILSHVLTQVVRQSRF